MTRSARGRRVVGTLGEHRLSTEKAIKTFIITGKIPHTLSRTSTKTLGVTPNNPGHSERI